MARGASPAQDSGCCRPRLADSWVLGISTAAAKPTSFGETRRMGTSTCGTRMAREALPGKTLGVALRLADLGYRRFQRAAAKADILWQNTTNGDVHLWNSNGSGGFTGQDLGSSPRLDHSQTGLIQDLKSVGARIGTAWRSPRDGVSGISCRGPVGDHARNLLEHHRELRFCVALFPWWHFPFACGLPQDGRPRPDTGRATPRRPQQRGPQSRKRPRSSSSSALSLAHALATVLRASLTAFDCSPKPAWSPEGLKPVRRLAPAR